MLFSKLATSLLGMQALSDKIYLMFLYVILDLKISNC